MHGQNHIKSLSICHARKWMHVEYYWHRLLEPTFSSVLCSLSILI